MKSNRFQIVLCFVFFAGLGVQDASAYYAPEMGRFISRDPIKYEAEDVNLYRYVFNAPNTQVDIHGLQVGKEWELLFPDGGNPLPPSPPPKPPTPTGKGCPKGWKMIQKSPPVPNGCGPAGGGPLVGTVISLGQWWGGIDFTPACNDHDTCWGTCSKSREDCDNKFLQDMKDLCYKKYPGKGKEYLQRQYCLDAARKFHWGVSSTKSSDTVFDNARANHCECVCDK